MRIRTIKPEFWTDSSVVQWPYSFRLSYIAFWNAADDHGWLPDDPDHLRMLLFPNEPDFDMGNVVDFFVALGRIERFTRDDGKALLRITHWLDHQKVDHPALSKLAKGEPSRKLAIPLDVRRKVAEKYGCLPGERKEVQCYYCGETGSVVWHKLFSGRPSLWVTFTLELDHFIPEDCGGKGVTENLVLACRCCNRSKATSNPLVFATPRDSSRLLALDQGTRDQGSGEQGNVVRVRPDTRTNLSLIQKFKDQLTTEFKRTPRLIWPPGDEQALIEICARPEASSELLEVLEYRKANPAFFPRSISSLLGGWDKTLDQARSHETTRAPEPESVEVKNMRAMANQAKATYEREQRERNNSTM